jgi:uncharacterized protein (DUF362 family)
MARADESPPNTDLTLSYDIFRHTLEVAERHALRMRARLQDAERVVHWQEREPPVIDALEESWRIQSALGALLAMDDIKAEQAGYRDTKVRARQAFIYLRDHLRDSEHLARGPDRELQGYVRDLAALAERMVRELAETRATIQTPGSSPNQDARLPRAADGADPEVGRPLTGARPDDFGTSASTSSGAAGYEGAKPRVAIARTRRRIVGERTIEKVVRAALDHLGGMSTFVEPGQTVLIKPNQTTFFLAHEGITTDPRVVRALIRLAREAGAARIVVGESSGGGGKTRDTMKVTGMLRAAKAEGAEVIPFDECEQREVEIPGGEYVRRIRLPAPLLEADVIINAPKLKVHHMDPISGAIKNWVGCLRADVREHYHDWHAYQQYAEIMTVATPTLTVMDGIYLGEGNGPVACQGRFFGTILASADPVALDSTAARILGFDHRHVTFAMTAASYGLGEADPARIEIVGVPFEGARTTVKAPRIGMDYIDANIIVGLDVSHSGTMGHFKSIADLLHEKGIWKRLIDLLHGRPTVLIGNAEDPLFEKHVAAGPYVVIDDAAPARYREDPRTYLIPGHPVLHNMLPLLLEGLRIPTLGEVGMEMMKGLRMVETRLRQG